ncbi:OmpA/MotB domain protein [Leptothrix cholodnii SP-6]|uniref:OmpA/MotB domain protein n=1 Tax=Leptothrix cholodnii (strain ATCC 51168 / LMG 8142 / SP-6) TaxID=395495 RepID=B1Y0D1_LEPCP|nr:phosphate ABC transporter substrate-binding/OmpA family protein [Leptothrix cholodnii]ACB36610.1 OmpA/MotB domain protein [Leptothrix cholodnii SP-6]
MNAPATHGICTNLPSACSHAATRTPVPMSTPETRCPECQARLLPAAATTPAAATRGLAPWVIATALALLAAALLVGWLLMRPGNRAAPAKPAAAASTLQRAGTVAGSGDVVPQLAPGTQTLRVHGSNTVGAALAPALLESFLRQQGYTEVTTQPGARLEERVMRAANADGTARVEVQLHAHGTATAFTDLAAGTADVGMASRPIKKDELAATQALGDLSSAGSEHVIALDGLAVVVNPANPVQRLSIEQLRRVFSGQVTNWAEVGGTSGPIVVHARDDKSGTYDTFKSLVLGKDALVGTARRHEDSTALSDAVALDPQAIGFIGLPYVRNASAVSVSDGAAVPLRPSHFTVATEDYALSRRLYLYVGREAPELARRFVTYAASDEAQRIADAQGFIGQLPDASEPGAAAVAVADLPPAYRALTDGGRRLSVNLRFVAGAEGLDNKARRDMGRIVRLLERRLKQDERVMLLGFSDALGGDCANQRLSQQRATAVATELATYGVRPAVVHGFGSAAPIASNETGAGRERNRRVEVWLTSKAVAQPEAVKCASPVAAAASR